MKGKLNNTRKRRKSCCSKCRHHRYHHHDKCGKRHGSKSRANSKNKENYFIDNGQDFDEISWNSGDEMKIRNVNGSKVVSKVFKSKSPRGRDTHSRPRRSNSHQQVSDQKLRKRRVSSNKMRNSSKKLYPIPSETDGDEPTGEYSSQHSKKFSKTSPIDIQKFRNEMQDHLVEKEKIFNNTQPIPEMYQNQFQNMHPMIPPIPPHPYNAPDYSKMGTLNSVARPQYANFMMPPPGYQAPVYPTTQNYLPYQVPPQFQHAFFPQQYPLFANLAPSQCQNGLFTETTGTNTTLKMDDFKSKSSQISKNEVQINFSATDKLKSISTITGRQSEYPYEYSQDNVDNNSNTLFTTDNDDGNGLQIIHPPEPVQSERVHFENGTFDVSQGQGHHSENEVFMKPAQNPDEEVGLPAKTISFRNRRRTKELIDQITSNDLYNENEKSMLIKIIQEKSQGGKMILDSNDQRVLHQVNNYTESKGDSLAQYSPSQNNWNPISTQRNDDLEYDENYENPPGNLSHRLNNDIMIQDINLNFKVNEEDDNFLEPIKAFLRLQKEECSQYQTEDFRPSCQIQSSFDNMNSTLNTAGTTGLNSTFNANNTTLDNSQNPQSHLSSVNMMNFSQEKAKNTNEEILITHNESDASLNWDLVNQSISKNANLGSMSSTNRGLSSKDNPWMASNAIPEESCEESYLNKTGCSALKRCLSENQYEAMPQENNKFLNTYNYGRDSSDRKMLNNDSSICLLRTSCQISTSRPNTKTTTGRENNLPITSDNRFETSSRTSNKVDPNVKKKLNAEVLKKLCREMGINYNKLVKIIGGAEQLLNNSGGSTNRTLQDDSIQESTEHNSKIISRDQMSGFDSFSQKNNNFLEWRNSQKGNNLFFVNGEEVLDSPLKTMTHSQRRCKEIHEEAKRALQLVTSNSYNLPIASLNHASKKSRGAKWSKRSSGSKVSKGSHSTKVSLNCSSNDSCQESHRRSLNFKKKGIQKVVRQRYSKSKSRSKSKRNSNRKQGAFGLVDIEKLSSEVASNLANIMSEQAAMRKHKNDLNEPDDSQQSTLRRSRLQRQQRIEERCSRLNNKA